MVDGGVLEGSGDLGEVHFPLPDQGLAFLYLYSADIVSGGDAHLSAEEGC